MCEMSSSGKVVVATIVLGFHYLKKSQPLKARQCPTIPPALFTCEMLAPSTGSSRERRVPSIKGRPALKLNHFLSVTDTMPSTGTEMKTAPRNDDPVSSESYRYIIRVGRNSPPYTQSTDSHPSSAGACKKRAYGQGNGKQKSQVGVQELPFSSSARSVKEEVLQSWRDDVCSPHTPCSSYLHTHSLQLTHPSSSRSPFRA